MSPRRPLIVSYRDLEVWQAAMDNVIEVYRLTTMLPPDERFSLSAQMRRSAVSIPANIAEGHARDMPRATVNHFRIALGSLAELETELEVAIRLAYFDPPAAAVAVAGCARVGQMLHALIAAVVRTHRLDDAR